MLALPGHTSEQRTLSNTQNNHLTGKAPYKFESGLLQRVVSCEPAPFIRAPEQILGNPKADEAALSPPNVLASAATLRPKQFAFPGVPANLGWMKIPFAAGNLPTG